MSSGLLLALAFAVACMLIGLPVFAWVLRQLVNNRIVDSPSWRSFHKRPVARGGGLGFAVLLIPAMVFMAFTRPEQASVLLGALLIFVIGFSDDLLEVSVFLRFMVQIFVALVMAKFIIDHATLPQWMDISWGLPLLILYFIGFINLFNFMDGIDGLSGLSVIHLAAGALLVFFLPFIFSSNPWYEGMALLGSLVGAALAFLRYNWSPARIFLGDSGSTLLGYLLAWAMIELVLRGHWEAALILPGYYYADGGITLLKRILRGDRFWVADRLHFYHYAHHTNNHSHARLVLQTLLVYLVLQALSLAAVTTGISSSLLILCISSAVLLCLVYLAYLSYYKLDNG